MKKLIPIGLLIIVFITTVRTNEDCSKVECKGPIRYYEDIKCKPIYSKDGNTCCPIKYDCSHYYKNLDKCVANGNYYDVGAKLKDEDRPDPCYVDCQCTKEQNEMKFVCGEPQCTHNKRPLKKHCYMKRKLDTCCHMEKVCPSRWFKWRRVKCMYDGQEYGEGKEFRARNDTSVICQCEKGFKGKVEAPYCRNITCSNEIPHVTEIRKNCAPVFFGFQKSLNSCNYGYKCQSRKETVKHESKDNSEENMCTYGTLKLRVGDTINNPKNNCHRCECELPPAVSCYETRDCNEPRNPFV